MSGHDHDHNDEHEGHDHEGHAHDDHDHDHDGHDSDEQAERRARRQIALSQIRQYGDPVLRMRANEIEAFDAELERLSERMLLLMHDADGVGLAATQVGILRRLFVFNDDGEDRVVVNPVLAATAKETDLDEEGVSRWGPCECPSSDRSRQPSRDSMSTVRRCASSWKASRRASCNTSSIISTAR